MTDKIDKMDAHILNLLQRDASLSVKEIAASIGLSISPTFERIKRLKREGYIERTVVIVNREKLGRHLLVMCTVTLKQQSLETLKNFEEAVSVFSEVLEILCIAGNHDYLLKIAVRDVEDYHVFVMKNLSTIPNVANVSSNFVLKEIKKEKLLEIKL
ncbi:Lrp/AsnC family transcriptional regulator [Olivibacter sp. SDN3]|uniref:Lrp/AsnC family transcriptional regulator n=1 Tax=Olivibacter sp. SDN3 TaxID=2764720 RepID=UPI0016511FD3|nr:Lrp/AsnC family transcriptional regulator [Olivibacter sp. SDN3]QNL50626.1 Lrp/AsnC family transcriptional regulator [Olivibacter sp. SDN3]